MLDIALKYAAIKWPVLPVGRDKVPRTEHGSHDATCDENKIREWFDGKQGLGLGLATGEISRIAVIDFDSGKPELAPTVEEFIRTYKLPPSPVRSKTGSGGSHHFYRIPEGKKVSNAVAFKGFKGVDIRGTGGYVVLPPSYNSVGPYEWEEGCSPFDAELPEAPEILFNTVRTISVNMGQETKIEKNTRNTSLTAIAGRLRSSGLEHDDLLNEMLRQNATLCVPPLDREEVEKIVDSICRYPTYNNKTVVSEAANEPILESTADDAAPRLGDLLRFNRTDAGRAEMVCFLHKNHIKYNFRDGKYYLWDGSRWRKSEKDEMTRIVFNAARRLGQAAQTIADDADRKDALNKAKSLEGADKIKACLTIFRSLSDVATDGSDWDSDPYLLGVKNGIVDLRTGELIPSNRDILMALDTHINYNVQAKCPRWEQFLKEIFNDDASLIDFVQKSAGYALTGLTTEQCIFLLVGDGANGKSVFLDVVQTVMGDYGTTSPFSTFEKQQNATTMTNDVAALSDKRLVTSSETASSATFNEARIKALTGGEKMPARFLYQEQFNFTPMMKLWLAVNHAPRVQDDSYGFWRRMRRINFTRQFIGDEADPFLGVKLKAEAEGILMWMIRGAVRWFKEGLTVPESVKKAVKEYQKGSDTLNSFIASAIELVEDENSVVSGEDLYIRYVSWCRVGNLPMHERLSRDSFHTAMGKHLKVKLDDKGKKVYTGIKLVPDASHSEGVSITLTRV